MDVTAADATGGDFDEGLIRGGNGAGKFHDIKLAIAVRGEGLSFWGDVLPFLFVAKAYSVPVRHWGGQVWNGGFTSMGIALEARRVVGG